MQFLRVFTFVAPLILFAGCGLELGWPEPIKDKAAADDQPKLRIFVTHATTDGLIGSGGIGQADSLCEQDQNSPADGIFKALLSDGTNRVAMPVVQRRDWVLTAKRTYTRVDGTVVGTTTSQAVFPFPLKAPISATSVEVWTGLSGGGWTNAVNCEAWTKNGTESGMVGRPNLITVDAFAAVSDTCGEAHHLVCVEQPPVSAD